MYVLQKETLTDQLVALLERDLHAGKFPPGCSLPSIRKLAQEYGLGVQVVSSALKVLTDRSLLVSRNRVGVFVNPDAFIPRGRRVITVRPPGSRSNYVEDLLRLQDSTHYGLLQNENLTASCSSQTMTEFIYELERFRMLNPDAVLLMASRLHTRDIGRILAVELPTAFIGEFLDGPAPEGSCNQFLEDTAERAAAMVEAAVAAGRRNLCLLDIPNRPGHYVALFRNQVADAARRRGARFRYVPVDIGSPPGAPPRAITARSWETALRPLFGDKPPDALLVDPFGDSFLLAEALETLGVKLGKELDVVCRRDPAVGMIYLQEHYHGVAEAASKHLQDLFANPGHRFGKVVFTGRVRREFMRMEPLRPSKP